MAVAQGAFVPISVLPSTRPTSLHQVVPASASGNGPSRLTSATVVLVSALATRRLGRLGRRASVSTFRKRQEKLEQRRRWLEGLEKPKEEDEEVEVPSGTAPVFPAAAESQEFEGRSSSRGNFPEPLNWDDPGLNVLERARLAAEDWGNWDEFGWSTDPAASSGSDEFIPLPRIFKKRRAEAEPPKAIQDFIQLHQLGLYKLPKLKQGEKRPAIFAGSDPAHDGRRGAVDDGRSDALGRMAIAVHKGFMRQRARCHPLGLRDAVGSFPLPERPEVAFIGASNVGKSSLLNALTRTQKLAPAKDDPGVTRSIDWYKCSRLPVDVIDLPGYGYAKGSEYGAMVADFITQRKSLRLLYCLVDARTGIRPSDWKFYASLGEKGPEKVFILTKCDMVIPKTLGKVATLVLEDIKGVPRSSQRLIMVSARMGQGMHDLRSHLCAKAVSMLREVKKRQEKLNAA